MVTNEKNKLNHSQSLTRCSSFRQNRPWPSASREEMFPPRLRILWHWVCSPVNNLQFVSIRKIPVFECFSFLQLYSTFSSKMTVDDKDILC